MKFRDNVQNGTFNAFFGLLGTLGAVEHSYGVIVQKSVCACSYGKKQFAYTRVHGEQKRGNTIIIVYIRKRAYTIHAAANALYIR